MNKFFKLNFPKYEDIKKLPLDKEYNFTLFNIIGTVYCRFTYNEDNSERFFLDIMCNGFSDMIEFFPNTHNHSYYGTKTGYEQMCNNAELVYNKILNNMFNLPTEWKELEE